MPKNVCLKLYQAFPARYGFVILSFFGILNIYAMRVNLSVAMVAMVNSTMLKNKEHPENACENLIYPDTNGSTKNLQVKGKFNWDSRTQGTILGSFFYGYIITQVPGGLAAEKFGGKRPFGFGLLITCIFTLLTPLAAKSGVWAMIVVRFVDGLGEGVAFPSMNCLIGRWVPKGERSRVANMIYMGIPLGTVLGMSLTGVLSASSLLGGWPSVFYVFGAIGIVWFIFWMIFIYDTPSLNPRITKEELDFIYADRGKIDVGMASFPWKSAFKSVPLWALAVTHLGHNWGFLTLLTEMPTYLANILHFSQVKNGSLSALPYLMQAIVSLFASFIADKLRISGRCKITIIRKIFNSLEFYGAGICLLGVAFAGCRPVVIVTLFAIAVGLIGCMNSGFNVTHVDMSPEFAGTLMAITNTVSNLSGFLAPAYISWITESGQTVKNWSTVFITASCVYFFTGTVYNWFCTCKLQSWGLSARDPKRNKTDDPGIPMPYE